MSNDIKKCPFCGSNAEFLYDDYDPETGEGDDGIGWITCTNLHCRAMLRDDMDSAVEKWNKRASEQVMIEHGMIKTVFLVIGDNMGAHEPEPILSIWTTSEAAENEKERVNAAAKYQSDRAIRIDEVELNKPSNEMIN